MAARARGYRPDLEERIAELNRQNGPTAESFLSRLRRGLRRRVQRWTGEYQSPIDQVLEDLQPSQEGSRCASPRAET